MLKKLYRTGTVLLALLMMTTLLPFPFIALAEQPKGDLVIFQNTNGLKLEEKKTQSITFSVPQEGDFMLLLDYFALQDKSITPQLSLLLKHNNSILSDTVADLPRIWRSNLSKGQQGRFERDYQGNELMPTQTEVEGWQQVTPPLEENEKLHLSQGEYTLTMTMVRQAVLLRTVTLVRSSKGLSYEQYKAKWDAEGKKDVSNQVVRQEAELTDCKSHLEITLSYDRTTPAVSPNHPSQIRYNILGGSGYGTEGQWASWKVKVPESGYYSLDFIYRQNISNGLSVRRRLWIDGEVPFQECDTVLFPYTNDFTDYTLAEDNGSPYRFYLTEGVHELRLEVVLTGLKDALEELKAIVRKLNSLYSKMMIIIGETPDGYRDYDLDKSIPDLTKILKECSNRLNVLGKQLDGDADSAGSNTARLYEAARALQVMAAKVRDIPKRMDNFRSQINTMADLLGNLRSQPLELDYFVLHSPDSNTTEEQPGFWDTMAFRVSAFFSSFVQDYNAVSGVGSGRRLTVWVSANDLSVSGYATGRDQAQIINRLITDNFTPSTDISVNVSLINTSDTLLPALVSGKGPDVALFVPKTLLMNLFYRNALVDLREMPDYEKIEKRFYPSAMISLRVGEKVYALPEVQSYNMLFYRTDILAENGLKPPETWEEFYSVLAHLQKGGMQIGIAESPQIYEMFLLQNGGTLYDSEMRCTNMTEQASVDAFATWTNLYVKYGLPVSFEPLNRFRTGQMPVVLASSYFYGQLAIGAPEIAELWKMAPVPGKRRTDGSIDRSEVCNISGAVVVEKSPHRADAFRFLDWWTSDETQARFGFESEAKMGISARYFPANKSTLSSLSWTAEEFDVLSKQWKQVNDNPQSPAAYYVSRNLSNAYRRVVYEYENPRDVIFRYGRMIDDELTRKRVELGLEAKQR